MKIFLQTAKETPSPIRQEVSKPYVSETSKLVIFWKNSAISATI